MTLSPSATVLHIFEPQPDIFKQHSPYFGENVTRATLENTVFHPGS